MQDQKGYRRRKPSQSAPWDQPPQGTQPQLQTLVDIRHELSTLGSDTKRWDSYGLHGKFPELLSTANLSQPFFRQEESLA
jgi:hypothetical protein